MKVINIIINDDNRFFSAGLKSSLNKYAQVNNKVLCFLNQDAIARPDVIFVSSRRSAAHGNGGAPVVMIKERPIISHEASRVLYRTDSLDKLFVLLSEILSDIRATSRFEYQPLTRRERQVVNYLRNGFDQSQTARLLGVSVKTVHSHKRSVMRKLMLSRNHEFIYWLLSQEGEYS